MLCVMFWSENEYQYEFLKWKSKMISNGDFLS